MDINILIQAVSGVGFPIVAVIVLFKILREDLVKLTEAVNNNTSVMTRIMDRLDKLEGMDK